MFHDAVAPEIHHLVVIVQNSRERGWVSQHTNATRERVGNAHTAAFRFLALGSIEVPHRTEIFAIAHRGPRDAESTVPSVLTTGWNS